MAERLKPLVGVLSPKTHDTLTVLIHALIRLPSSLSSTQLHQPHIFFSTSWLLKILTQRLFNRSLNISLRKGTIEQKPCCAPNRPPRIPRGVPFPQELKMKVDGPSSRR